LIGLVKSAWKFHHYSLENEIPLRELGWEDNIKTDLKEIIMV
jgi:hypothetical protein